jgi:lipooligosaccharide transport system ATP-binding protein
VARRALPGGISAVLSPPPVPVVARALSKRFGSVVAVDGIDFDVRAGECVGFLGPNGAGKTTTVRMVSCQSPKTSGTIEVFGLDVDARPREVKAMLGVCPQENNADSDFSVRRNLLVFARFYGIGAAEAKRRADELIAWMQLADKADAKVEELSGGMKRRLVLARSLLNRPRLLILDEPTTGLDPQARHLIWARVRQLKADGTTCLLTTHYMDEAAQLCDRVILMDQGKILLEGAPAQVVAAEAGREVVEIWNAGADVREFVKGAGWRVEETEDRLYVYDREGGVARAEIERRFPAQDRLLRHATLEDVFLLRTGRTLRD